MEVLNAQNELDAMRQLITTVLHDDNRVDGSYERLNLAVTIPFDEAAWRAFQDFEEDYLARGGFPCERGHRVATRVYTDPKDRMQKPSYTGRIRGYVEHNRRSGDLVTLNQIDEVCKRLAEKPRYSHLTFQVGRPDDLALSQARSGNVPCLTGGQFLYRDGHLNMSAVFRSNNVLRMGYTDILHLRRLQLEVLEQAQEQTEKEVLKQASPGTLTITFNRAFVDRPFEYKATVDGKRKAQRLYVEQNASDVIEGLENSLAVLHQ